MPSGVISTKKNFLQEMTVKVLDYLGFSLKYNPHLSTDETIIFYLITYFICIATSVQNILETVLTF